MSVNAITSTGLTIQTLPDVVSEILNGSPPYPGFYQIYGIDVNISPNSPDGQMITIFAQGKIDVLELCQSIYNNFDPDQAVGVSLDKLCAINGVARNAGTYTQQDVTITAGISLTLPGLDLYPTSPFTVADGNGNQYQLVTTYNFVTAGSQSLLFQAALLGAIQSAPNTITVPVTIIAGVTSVNNPAGPVAVGQTEETDSALRIRRSNSVALPSKGWLAGMYAGVIDVAGVTQAIVLENKGSTANGYGMPPHSIWIIVAGNYSNTAVANAIYVKRNACVDWMNGGTGGAGTASLTGTAVGAIAVATAGSGYDNAPTVTLTGGGGTGATAHAVVSGGAITSFVVDTGGTGYTSAPTVVLNGQTQVVPITQMDGTTFDVFFDKPITQSLWFQATIVAITGSVDLTYIAAQIFAEFGSSYGINQSADTASIIAFIKQIAPNSSVSAEGVSKTSSSAGFSTLVAPNNVNYQFVIPNVGAIALTA